jgi:ABC-type bacteriocin/lantibiotic exporter with double-glycine peptidase domain
MEPESTKANTSYLWQALKKNIWKVLLTYLHTLIENGLQLLYPMAIGVAINALLEGKGYQSLYLLAGIWFSHVIFGTLHQIFDTRLFTRIYEEAASAMIKNGLETGFSTSELSARTGMMDEVIEFLEYEIPFLMQSLIGIAGSLVLLSVYNIQAGLVMGGALLPVVLIQLIYGRRALSLSESLNDRREKLVETIEKGRSTGISLYFRTYRRWKVLLSDANAFSWSISDIISLLSVLLVLLVLTRSVDISSGDMFAALSYVLTITGALEFMPDMVEGFAHLIDVTRRSK